MYAGRWFGDDWFGDWFGDQTAAPSGGGYFGHRYFGQRYFGPRYFSPQGEGVGSPLPGIAGGYFGHRYFPAVYFGPRYFAPDADVVIVITPEGEVSGGFRPMRRIQFDASARRLRREDEEMLMVIVAWTIMQGKP